MSSKRTTKASAILQVASQRVDETEAIRDDLRTQLMIAQAIYEAAVTTFKSLEAVLGSEPAKPKAPRAKRSDSGTKRKGLPTGDKSNGQIGQISPPPEA